MIGSLLMAGKVPGNSGLRGLGGGVVNPPGLPGMRSFPGCWTSRAKTGITWVKLEQSVPLVWALVTVSWTTAGCCLLTSLPLVSILQLEGLLSNTALTVSLLCLKHSKGPIASGIQLRPQDLDPEPFLHWFPPSLKVSFPITFTPPRYTLVPPAGSVVSYSEPLPITASDRPDWLLPTLQDSVKMSFPALSSGFPRHIIHTFGRAHIKELGWEYKPHLYSQLLAQCLVDSKLLVRIF